MEVDTEARRDWITLYASDPLVGKMEAMSIVHKLLKKDSGGHGARNPSGFVVSAVGHAWREVRDLPSTRKRQRRED